MGHAFPAGRRRNRAHGSAMRPRARFVNAIIPWHVRFLGARTLRLCPECGTRLRLVGWGRGTRVSCVRENCAYSDGAEAHRPPEHEDTVTNTGLVQAADSSEEEADYKKQRADFLTELHGDSGRCSHPPRFREWSMENPSQDIGWNVSERRTYRCRICGKVVTERV